MAFGKKTASTPSKKKKTTVKSSSTAKALKKRTSQGTSKRTSQSTKKKSSASSKRSSAVKSRNPQTVDLMAQKSRRLNIDNTEYFRNRELEAQRNSALEDVVSFDDFDTITQEHKGALAPDSKRSNTYREGVRTAKDCYAPDSVSVVDERSLRVGDKYVRNFVMQGYPTYAQVGWLDSIYSYPGNLDTIIYVEPQEARNASEEITKQITAITAQLNNDTEKGNIRNTTKYRQEIQRLETERARIESNTGSFYKTQIFSNLLCDTKKELETESAMLEATLQGQRMNFMPTALRMTDGYRSALPMMRCYYEDKFRNMNDEGITACFPFYNSEISHEGGVLLGVNEMTGTPMFLNPYDKKAVNNTNGLVIGQAGSGKSFLVKLLTSRSALMNIHTAIIDPEGEYGPLAIALGGVSIEISNRSKERINPFDISEEEELDDDGNSLGYATVKIDEKVQDMLNLLQVMAQGQVTQEQTSLITDVLMRLYAEFGITADPRSLLNESGDYDPTTGQFYAGRKKVMPTLTDFHTLLLRMIQEDPNQYGVLAPFANQIKMYRKDGAYGLFDCQSTVDASRFDQYPVINFDVNDLEENTLRPIGMYVAMSYVWEKFVKKSFNIRKRVVCDEAWMLTNRSMPGFEYTAAFLEKCARRIRKRNAGLWVASQNFVEFTDSKEGRSVISNAAIQILLKQASVDIHAVQQEFHLSDGEAAFLKSAEIGEFLIKTNKESAVGRSVAAPFEKEIIDARNAVTRR